MWSPREDDAKTGKSRPSAGHGEASEEPDLKDTLMSAVLPPGPRIDFYCLGTQLVVVCGDRPTLFESELALLSKPSEMEEAAFPRVTLLRQASALFRISEVAPRGEVFKRCCQPRRPCWYQWGSMVRLWLDASQSGCGGGWLHSWIQSTTPCRQGSLTAICLLHSREIHGHREGCHACSPGMTSLSQELLEWIRVNIWCEISSWNQRLWLFPLLLS